MRLRFINYLTSVVIFSLFFLIETSYGQYASRPPTRFDLRNFYFNFTIPGARATALGGAFISIADDATAAAINPAGLTFLAQPEISIVNRFNRFTHDEIAGTNANPDLRADFHDSGLDQSYASLVYPYKRFSVAIYREELIEFESSHESNQFLTIDTSNPLPLPLLLGGSGNFPGKINKVKKEVANWGGALSYKFHNRFRAGFSLTVSKLEFQFSEKLFFDSSFFSIGNNQNKPLGNVPESLYLLRTADESSSGFNFNLGFLGKPLPSLSVGFVYNNRPKFDLKNELFFPAFFIPDFDPDDGTDESFFLSAETREEKVVFRIPDSYGIGASYRISDDLTFAVDAVRIKYSELLKEIDTNLSEDDSFDSISGAMIDQDGMLDLMIDDATEIHFGVEYILHIKKVSIPLGFGIFTDPAHVVFTTIDDANLRRQFPEERGRTHFTIGCGVTLNDNITFDAALNFSEDIAEFLGATAIRF